MVLFTSTAAGCWVLREGHSNASNFGLVAAKVCPATMGIRIVYCSGAGRRCDMGIPISRCCSGACRQRAHRAEIKVRTEPWPVSYASCGNRTATDRSRFAKDGGQSQQHVAVAGLGRAPAA
jgi:hypothetical protein